MKIMYLLFSFTVGGTERLVANICNQMENQNEEVHLYIINDLIDDNLLNTLNENIHVKLLRRKVGSKDKISPLFKVAKYIKKNKIEVVHCNSFNAPELLILSKIVNPNCKVVSTIHGMGQFENIGKNKILLKNWVCDKFIGISNAVAGDIVAAGIDEKKVVKVYNGIETKKYDCAKLKKYDENIIVIGCVARIMPELKGQDILLEAIKIVKKQHPKVMALFAGGVAENQQKDYENLKNYVRDNFLEENVKFLGNVDNIPEFLNKIDICVVPSRSEGFGLALVEAMAMGVPCIASNIAGPAEIIKNEETGILFNNGDSVELANKIIKTIGKYQEYKEDAWKKRTRIVEKYSIETMCEQLITLYGKVKANKYANSKLAGSRG